MVNKEQSEKIKATVESINNALSELEKGGNIAFFKSLIQKAAIEIYEQAGQLDKSGEVREPQKPHIKIISQTEVLKKVNPEIPKQDPPKPEVPEIIADTTESIKEIPATKQVVNETPVMEAPVQEIKKPEPVIEKKSESVINIPVYKKEERKTEIHEISGTIKNVNTDEDDSLNAKLSKSIKPVLNIVEKSKDTPIKDLVKAISVSKKFEFIKVLFGGNSEEYKNTLNSSQNANSYEEAIQYLQNNISGKYDWSSEESEALASEFYSLVRRRHMN